MESGEMGMGELFYCNRVVVQAPGKVNLSLDILGDDTGGYHLLETVMQAVDLCDVLVIGRRSDGEIRVTCSRPDVPEDDTNIAYRSAQAFFSAAGIREQGVSIHIDKSIPVQAGLAGGSADGAAVLVGLNRLYEMSFSTPKLCEIGLEVGADVPFCIAGGIRLAKGRGENMSPLPSLPDCRIAIAKPPQGMSTRYAFQLYDKYADDVSHPDTRSMLDAIAAGNLEQIGGAMRNIFEQLGAPDEVEMLKGIMLCDGAVGSVMSGSGSAVIGLFASEKEGRTCLRHLREQVAESWLVKPLGHGANVLHVS